MPVKTVNEQLLDALIRHQIYLLRYSGHVRNRVIDILNANEVELAARIRDKLRSLKGLRTPKDWERLQALQAALEAYRMASWKEATDYLLQEMIDLAYQEPIQLSQLVQTVSPVEITTVVPASRLLKSIVLSRPFQGRLLKDWAANMAKEDVRRIHAAIQSGMLAGESMDSITRRVIGTQALKGADGVTQLTRRNVQAIVRTAVQHVANRARDEFFNENAILVSVERFVATLDSRTTPICRANDGKTFKRGKGPRPPLHIACRSLRVAELDGNVLGLRPFKPTTERTLMEEYSRKNGLGTLRSRSQLPRGHKGSFDAWSRKRIRELTGRVPAKTSYQDWLTRQSVAFQEDVLGVTKAKLFRDGKLALDKFVNRNGDELTLSELARKHGEAFRAAGLDPANY